MRMIVYKLRLIKSKVCLLNQRVEKNTEYFIISMIYKPTFTYKRIALPAKYLHNSTANDLN